MTAPAAVRDAGPSSLSEAPEHGLRPDGTEQRVPDGPPDVAAAAVARALAALYEDDIDAWS
ncbi:MAG: hypothetical protein JWP64_1399 [Pseudonocardia sp.]|uniref:hypothetical protein n=1 Tax=Pseudonocardia sp. TaxID=60912 RepID=UPI0026103FCF|nr:hypothetical protein [Pseudonocardia sp.]MCU1626450.1 hypothetical protein [Pseudonocardia sp.]MDT7703733.1 hypothetical protein [Pseudonocardiales bacterium]